MLSKEDVMAVVITYNPDLDILNNVYSIIKQVNELLIIDNCSGSNDLLKTIEKDYKVKIIYNNENMGIAYALNQGLVLAKNKKYKLFLTMDQDSLLCENCVDNMINILNNNQDIVSVGPNYFSDVNDSNVSYEEVDCLISSGNLVYTEKALDVNGYTEELFIDAVDFDFSLALRSRNGKLALVKNAYMKHNLGEILTLNYCGFVKNITTHLPIRYYYITRNHYYIRKKYIKKFTKFCVKLEILMWKSLIKRLIFHPNRKLNLYMAIRGIKDAKKLKYGKYSI